MRWVLMPVDAWRVWRTILLRVMEVHVGVGLQCHRHRVEWRHFTRWRVVVHYNTR